MLYNSGYMNKAIFKTIRAGFVLGAALLMFTGAALASGVLIPAGATDVTNTSARLNGEIINSNNNSTVWFEWADNSSMSGAMVAGKESFWSGSTFNTVIDGLNPNTSYYYRVVAVSKPIIGSASAPVYSPVISFKTTAAGGNITTFASTLSTTYGAGQNTTSANLGTTKTANTKNNNTSTTVVTKKTSTQTTVADTKEGFSNNGSNSASVFGVGNGMFPTTLTGWIILIIAIFIALLIVRMIYEECERRKKARLVKKPDNEVKEEQK